MWNISSAVKYDEPKTNNAPEGGNNALNRAFNGAQCKSFLYPFGPSIFISTLRKSYTEVETKYLQLAIGTLPTEPIAKKWKEHEARLKYIVVHYMHPLKILTSSGRLGICFRVLLCDSDIIGYIVIQEDWVSVLEFYCVTLI